MSICATFDGGCAIVGVSESEDGDVSGHHGVGDFWVVKLDQAGEIVWQKCLGGTALDVGLAIAETSDHGLILAGQTASLDGDITDPPIGGILYNDFWFVKLDADGIVQWNTVVSDPGPEYDKFIVSVAQTSDGGYIFSGEVTYTNISDVAVGKLNSSGEVLWVEHYGGSAGDHASGLIERAPGRYQVAGTTRSWNGDVAGQHGSRDGWVIEVDDDGDLLWQRAIGGTIDEEFYGIARGANGRTVLVGYGFSTDGDLSGAQDDAEAWVLALDTTAGIAWQTHMGVQSALSNQIWDIAPLVTQGYVMVGNVWQSPTCNGWVGMIDDDGAVQWDTCLEDICPGAMYKMAIASDGGILIISRFSENDYCVMKLGGSPLGVSDADLEHGITLAPVPAVDHVRIRSASLAADATFFITDLDGKQVRQGMVPPEGLIHTGGLPPGAYGLSIRTGTRVITRKLLVAPSR